MAAEDKSKIIDIGDTLRILDIGDRITADLHRGGKQDESGIHTGGSWTRRTGEIVDLDGEFVSVKFPALGRSAGDSAVHLGIRRRVRRPARFPDGQYRHRGGG